MTRSRRRWRRGAVAALGALLLAVPFVPLGALFGEIHGAGSLLPPTEWLLGLAIFLAGAWLIALAPGADRAARAAFRAWRSLSRSRAFAVSAFVGIAALLVAVSWLCFRHRPHLADSVVQLFHAKVFAAGSLTAPAPPGEAFFATQHMLVEGGRWFSQYPPGHVALLAVGVAAGVPWAVTILLSLGTAFFLYRFALGAYGREEATATLLLLLLSPFFWFMGGSFMNHVSSLFFISAFLWLYGEWDRKGGAGLLAGAGASLGGAFLVRPLTGLAAGAAFGIFGLLSAKRRGRPRAAAAGVAAFGAVAALYPLYNAATTGDPLLTGYVQLWGSAHGLGFHATPWGEVHTPLAGLRNELVDLSLLNLHLFEWPVPALLPVGLALGLGWLRAEWDRRLLLAFLAVPAAYFFYWHRDAFLGPRFLYGGLAFLLPLTGRAVVVGLRRLTDVRLSPFGFRPAAGPTMGLAFLALCFGFSVLYAVPHRFRQYSTQMRSMKVDLAREARGQGIEEGVIFVSVSWGNRILAHLRGLGVPASLAERAYRNVDHCRLDSVVKEARSEGWSRGRVASELRGRLAEAGPVVERPLNGDPTLRLNPRGSLGPECRDEVRYDRGGYANFTPHLAENSPSLRGKLVFARDLRSFNELLLQHYPDRPAYLYRGRRMVPLGRVGRSDAAGGRLHSLGDARGRRDPRAAGRRGARGEQGIPGVARARRRHAGRSDDHGGGPSVGRRPARSPPAAPR